MARVRPVSTRVLGCPAMSRTLWLSLIVVLAARVVWALLTDPPGCPRGFDYRYEHGRCVGNLEFDRR